MSCKRSCPFRSAYSRELITTQHPSLRTNSAFVPIRLNIVAGFRFAPRAGFLQDSLGPGEVSSLGPLAEVLLDPYRDELPLHGDVDEFVDRHALGFGHSMGFLAKRGHEGNSRVGRSLAFAVRFSVASWTANWVTLIRRHAALYVGLVIECGGSDHSHRIV
jgi:hypothetical protein